MKNSIVFTNEVKKHVTKKRERQQSAPLWGQHGERGPNGLTLSESFTSVTDEPEQLLNEKQLVSNRKTANANNDFVSSSLHLGWSFALLMLLFHSLAL